MSRDDNNQWEGSISEALNFGAEQTGKALLITDLSWVYNLQLTSYNSELGNKELEGLQKIDNFYKRFLAQIL